MTDIHDAGYGRQFADFYDRLFPGGPAVAQTVRRLADLHPGDGAATLELGVGTGRVALPLAELVGPIVGVDSSPEMLAVLTATMAAAGNATHPVGGPATAVDGPVTPVHGDLRDWSDGRRYGLVYCVCGTLSMLLDPEEQARAVQAAAARLAPGGTLVIETHNPAFALALNQGRARDSFFVPYPGQNTGLLSYSTIDAERRLWHLAHIWIEDGRSRIATELSRLTTPEEVDAYAERAGLRLVERHSDWSGTPFTGAEPMYVSVYRAGKTP
ncbi:methyltransferase domain-containing protein [Micromonosporaceae bacterium DT194]|uniref:methyltransferase domain-containing protein n=1 Tax=Melissospora conviva TaxID=3388432 RepID=UPI003C23B0E3